MTTSTMADRLQRWVLGAGAVWLTLAGVSLYAALRLPATLFYAQLEATPERAGLGYVDLLTGSTLGVIAVFILVGALFYALTFVVGFGSLYARMGRLMFSPETRAYQKARGKKTLGELTDDEFELRVDLLRRMYDAVPEIAEQVPFAAMEASLRAERLASIAQEEDPDNNARTTGQSGIKLKVFRLLFDTQAAAMRRHWKALVGVSAAAAFFVGLPLVAISQAVQVREGEPFIGGNLGLFAYQASPVDVRLNGEMPSGQAPIDPDGDYFLLGGTPQFVTLYDAEADVSIQVPASLVTITSRG
ncbi:hypothetical protein E8D34_10055 [Nocardioides sp. GY 10113]|uniref:hypothetical protein n=1 Tax=Nocardioides sp. GY 10113 TaxID=2569761 RepID=UPI0010A89587|nr:hypothetical protein [Nocardioides sp. GY 10113]TIC87459.1 hypothetical protein E8D34_10055 [Nocardioides sp. GY 10113]